MHFTVSPLNESARKPRVCLVAGRAYPVVNPSSMGTFGGLETLAWRHARALARRTDLDVSLAVRHHGIPADLKVENVTVVGQEEWVDRYWANVHNAKISWRDGKTSSWTSTFVVATQAAALLISRPFRTRHIDKWRSPWAMLIEADADVYLAFGVNHDSARTVATARNLGRPTVLMLMSDADLDHRFRDEQDYVDPYGVDSHQARFVLENVDEIIAQTPRQQRTVAEIWGRESTLSTNPLDLKEWEIAQSRPIPIAVPDAPLVLWIGRADRFHKRPLELLPVIHATPSTQFLMVVNPSDAEVARELKDSAPANLTVIDQLPAMAIPALMSRACMFASTGTMRHEGLPSVFMEAAASRLPIISLEAGAEWLNVSGAGVCAGGDRSVFLETIVRWADDRHRDEREKYAAAGRAYVEQHHESDVIAAGLERRIREVINASRLRGDK